MVLWTLVGAAAIALWATWPLLAVLSTESIPFFQFLTIIFAVGAVTLFVLCKNLSPVNAQPLQRATWLNKCFQAAMVPVGLLLSDIFFVVALHYLPPAQANLILYLWPGMVVLLGALLGLLALRGRDLVSVAIAMCGAALVIGPCPFMATSH